MCFFNFAVNEEKKTPAQVLLYRGYIDAASLVFSIIADIRAKTIVNRLGM